MPEHDGTQPPYDPAREDYSDRYEVVSPSAVEPKTKAAAYGAGAGSVISAFIVYLVDALFYNGEGVPPDVPVAVSAFIGLVVTSAVAFFASYYARHVNRVR